MCLILIEKLIMIFQNELINNFCFLLRGSLYFVDLKHNTYPLNYLYVNRFLFAQFKNKWALMTQELIVARRFDVSSKQSWSKRIPVFRYMKTKMHLLKSPLICD